jgi:hypothetical protein
MEKTMSYDLNSVIGRQSVEVQNLCKQFETQYAGSNSVQIRSEWGRMLSAIQNADLKTVNAKGESLEGDDPKGSTFSVICRELGIPRSTAYHYIDQYITVQTYPDYIQKAAAESGLNLAKPHVQAKFGELQAQGLPKNPSNLEVEGIIKKLQDASPPDKKGKNKGSKHERFAEMLREAIQFAKDNKIEWSNIYSALDSELRAAGWKVEVINGQRTLSAEL